MGIIALVHLFFNVLGILIFYPIPFMRFPIPMCKFLGNITAKYRWFAVVYILAMFLLIPCFLLVLRAAGVEVFWTVIGLFILLGLIILAINIIQKKKPSVLPPLLQDWNFLPSYLRSLEPYDKIISSVFPCGAKPEETNTSSELTRVASTRPLGPTNSFDSGIDTEKRLTQNL
ncbi:Sodium-dependent phosphate transport protein 2B [Armadillidium nasatum]|uniref:Sodium-dependent phosphate transport protein 2B n=1 Tax=Armadillidium nasatum TaxID=96803 RepID=A0A5N5TIV6_9CRUS|nr:Sodium-dependent phosphate transport protein 2B [Armadillidium nasatum]